MEAESNKWTTIFVHVDVLTLSKLIKVIWLKYYPHKFKINNDTCGAGAAAGFEAGPDLAAADPPALRPNIPGLIFLKMSIEKIG